MRSTQQPSLRKATTVGLGLIVLILLATVVISQSNTQRLIENQARVVHTQAVLATLEAVLARVTEAETGERGFLITGDEDYLRSYQSAVQQAGETLDRLSKLAAADQIKARDIQALKSRVAARFDELSGAIAAQREGGFDAAKHSVSTNQGRRLMNEMRKLVAEMQRQETRALADRSEQSRRSAQVTRVTNWISSLLGIGMVGLAFLLFRRELIHRERADAAQRHMAAIVESTDDAVMSKSLDGLIVSWNAGARRIYGYSAGEVIGRPITLLCPPERVDEVQYHLQCVRGGMHIEHFETTRVRKDGRRIDVALTISPIRDSHGNVIGASVIARDVSERKAMQREVLEVAAQEQQRIGQDLHDGTGQELTGLAMIAERLACEMAQQGIPQAATAEKIVVGLEQALRNVRALSKGLVPVELDAEGLMVALTDMAERTSELHGVQCFFQCDQPVCILDNQTATHLYRLSQEAVTNALKHGRAKNILIQLEDDGKLITLKVTDDGVGISTPEQSNGMGLRIMRYRAGLIRARLTVGRARPNGTQVVCTLAYQQDSHGEPVESQGVLKDPPEQGNSHGAPVPS